MVAIMTPAQRLQAASAPFATPVPIPAPVKGWNARDEFDAMDPLDAVQLDNWYPDAGGVYVRNGFSSFATITGSGAVETLAEFNAGSTNKLIAAANGKIYNASAGGAISSSLGSGFASDKWQTSQFLSHMFFCNGADSAQIFDGSSLGNASFTGVTTSTLVGVYQYQQRLFFWQNNSTGFWYAPLNSISGALNFYDLGAFSPNGGNLMAVTTVTHDGGNGVLDFIAFIMSSGDMILFYGNDPSLVSGWQEIGRYRLGTPVGPRAVASYGGDSFITTSDDHTMLQQQLVALKLGTLAPRSKVSTAVSQAVAANAGAFGWQAIYYPRGRRLIFNIPNPDGTFDQHVCNTGLPDQPWCRFVGMNAYCWGLFKSALYFGGAAGGIYLADVGGVDNVGPITATAQQAWNRMDIVQRKRIAAVRPVFQTIGNNAYNFVLGFDYGDLNILVPVTTSSVGSPWDISPWDVSPWSTEFAVAPSWRVGGGSGTAIGFGVSMSSTNNAVWYRTDLRIEEGNAL